MSEQPDLFASLPNVRARRNDPETSQEAAVALQREEKKLQASVSAVVSLLNAHGPMTDFQLADRWAGAWSGPFSNHLPRMARHWARKQGLVKHCGFGKHLNRRARIWGLGRDEQFLESLVGCCPHCGGTGRLSNAETGEPA